MWRMVGRPERSDPDEFLYNLFHSSTAPTGYNFVGYMNPEYDKLAEQQRQAVDMRSGARRSSARRRRSSAATSPTPSLSIRRRCAFNQAVWKAGHRSSTRSGIGIRNIWTFVGTTPLGAQKDHDHQLRHAAIKPSNPLYIAGAPTAGSPSSSGTASCASAPTACRALGGRERHLRRRQDRRRHDPRRHELARRPPVTVDDVIFSFEAPAGDKAPMYKPFVTDIEAIEQTGERGLRFKLKQANAAFATTPSGARSTSSPSTSGSRS